MFAAPPGRFCSAFEETPTAVALRDTQNREQGHLIFPTSEWASLLGDLRRPRA
ncbi:DUF397 domain-containing protein [Nocardiopsis coralli]|uniref:DUF397 domain-containing protein n=1 Tax=Nocardiopsis coralli TaxID=2772213 RepID=UPI002E282F71|nr:DUF397 domain-containing protein [Nocardiopsis coralli]